MKKIFCTWLLFAGSSLVFAGLHDDASDWYLPSNNLQGASPSYNVDEYNAANLVAEGILVVKLAQKATISASDFSQDLENVLTTLGSFEPLKKQLVQQLSQLPSDTSPFSSLPRGFYPTQATDLDLPRGNIKSTHRVEYTPLQYNVANYLLKILFEAQEKVKSYVALDDFCEILANLTNTNPDNASVQQLGTQLIGTEYQINEAGKEACKTLNRSQLVQTLQLLLKEEYIDPSTQVQKNISAQRAMLLCKVLGLTNTFSSTTASNAQARNPVASAPSVSTAPSAPTRHSTYYNDFDSDYDVGTSWTNNLVQIGGNISFSNGTTTIGGSDDNSGHGSTRRVNETINGGTSGTNREYQNCTINGGTSGTNSQYHDCTINGGTSGTNAQYRHCIINGSSSGTNAQYNGCTIRGSASGTTAQYSNCTIMGSKGGTNAQYNNCTFPNAAHSTSRSHNTSGNGIGNFVSNIFGGGSVMSVGGNSSMNINGTRIETNSSGVFVNGRQVSSLTGPTSFRNGALYINNTRVWP